MHTSEGVVTPKPSWEATPPPAVAKAVLPWIVEAGLWILLVSSPLALGSVSPVAYALMEGGCFGLLLLAWWGIRAPESVRVPASFRIVAGLFVLWSLLQMAPLPPSALKLLSPGTHRLYVHTLPGYSTPGGEVDLQAWLFQRKDGNAGDLVPRAPHRTGYEGKIRIRPGWRSVSWYPGQTLRWISRFLAYWALFVLVVRYLPENVCQRRLPWLVLVLGFLIAFQGVVQHYTWNGKIYWVIPVYQGGPFGPFVNSNNFSGYLEMALPLGGAVLLQASGVGRSRRRHRRSQRSRIPRLLLISFFLLCMIAALLMARSRGGIFALLLSAGTYLLMQVWRVTRTRGRRRLALVAGALPLVASVAGMVWYTLHTGRFQATGESGVEPSLAMRWEAWKGVLDMVAANPVSGTGLGTFGLAYPVFKTYGSVGTWQQAHNDYLQVLAESGIAGFLLLLVGLGTFARRFLLPTLRGAWREQPPVALGSAFGILVLLLHSLVEFNLQIPSNGLLFVLLGGLLVRSAHPEPG